MELGGVGVGWNDITMQVEGGGGGRWMTLPWGLRGGGDDITTGVGGGGMTLPRG